MERSLAICGKSPCPTARRWNSSTARILSSRRENMANAFCSVFGCAILIPLVALAQQTSGNSGGSVPAARADLSGVWSYAIDRAPAALKKEVNGAVTIHKIDQSA